MSVHHWAWYYRFYLYYPSIIKASLIFGYTSFLMKRVARARIIGMYQKIPDQSLCLTVINSLLITSYFVSNIKHWWISPQKKQSDPKDLIQGLKKHVSHYIWLYTSVFTLIIVHETLYILNDASYYRKFLTQINHKYTNLNTGRFSAHKKQSKPCAIEINTEHVSLQSDQ